MSMRSTGIFLLLGLALSSAEADTLQLSIRQHKLQVETAVTAQEREHGLMQRTVLCADCGMLFVFPRAERHAFWMKNTALPLSIAFIAPDGSIINIAEMQANTTDYHQAQGNALYALEMNRGWFSGNAIKAGDKVQGLEQAPAAQ
jgi:uncharacterized protein